MEHGHDLEGPVPRYAVLLRGEQMTVTVTWAAAPITVDGKPAHTAFPTYTDSQSGLKFKKKQKIIVLIGRRVSKEEIQGTKLRFPSNEMRPEREE